MTANLKARDLSKCCFCKKGIGDAGPVIYRLRVDQFFLDPQAIRRAIGFEMVMGQLAMAMCADEDLAKHVAGKEALVCGNCWIEPDVVPRLWDEPEADTKAD